MKSSRTFNSADRERFDAVPARRVVKPKMRRLLLPLIVPVASRWIEIHERRVLLRGIGLTEQQLADAVALGVAQPERVRLLAFPAVSSPRRRASRFTALLLRTFSPGTAGLTARYGILVREDFWGERRLIAHELAHTAQYERLGGIKPFLREYLAECFREGYPFGELELEAASAAQRICERTEPRKAK